MTLVCAGVRVRVHSNTHMLAGGGEAFVIHCCRWVLIRMCAGVQPNKIWQKIRRQRAAL